MGLSLINGILIGFGFVYSFLLMRCVQDIKKNDRNVPNIKDLDQLDAIIDQLDRSEVHDSGLHPQLSSVVYQVLGEEPGTGVSGRVPLATQPLELAVDARLRVRREWSGLFIMTTLLMTAIVLAYVFFRNSVAEEILGHFSYVFTVNAVALLTAVVLHLSYLHAKTEADIFLARLFAALGRLSDDVVRDIDPNLAAALEYVARQMEKWSEVQEKRNLETIEALTGEVRTLTGAIQEMFREAISPDDSTDEREETMLVLARSVVTASEKMSARVDKASEAIVAAVEIGGPAIRALEVATKNLVEKPSDIAELDLPKKFDTMIGMLDILATNIKSLPQRIVGKQGELFIKLNGLFEDLTSVITELREGLADANSKMVNSLAEELATKLDGSFRLLETSSSSHIESVLSTQIGGIGGQLDRIPDEIGKILRDLNVDKNTVENVDSDLDQQRADILAEIRNVGSIAANISSDLENVIGNQNRRREAPDGPRNSAPRRRGFWDKTFRRN